jgi:hypothetical protein
MLHFIFLLSQTSLQLYLLSIPLNTYYIHIYESIVHGDPNIHGGIADLNFTHTIISEGLITRMGVENSFAYTTRNEINIENEDEDEYTPREKLSTGETLHGYCGYSGTISK